MSSHRFQSLNLRSEIGGNSYALHLDDELIILDAGMHPKEDGSDAIPRYAEIPFDSANGIVVTHSHLDHIGTLPVLQEHQPSAPVFMTAATAAIGEALLHNSVNVMKSQRLELGIVEYPLYTHHQIDRVQSHWMAKDYERSFLLDPSGASDTELTFFDAGHIMGSAGVAIRAQGKTIFYTGDVHFDDHTLSKGARFPKLASPDVLIMESTRGAVPRKAGYTLASEQARLAKHIKETVERGGAVMIPVFAIGKTQEVLTMIHGFKEDGLIPEKTPVIIGGLSTKMTTIYDAFAKQARRTRPGFEIIREMDIPIAARPRDRKPIEYQAGAVFAISSGMMSEHTVSNTLARGFLSNPKNTLLFVGYADPVSPAGLIRSAKKGDLIALDNSHKVELNCQVEEFDFSGHATRDDLLEFAVNSRAKNIFLVHGDPDATEWLKVELEKRLPDSKIIIPEPKKEYAF